MAITDLQLAAIEIDTLWTKDTRGRIVATREARGTPAPLLVIAVTGDGQVAAVSDQLPERLAVELERTVAQTPAPPSLDVPSAAVARCERLLPATHSPVRRSSGWSYRIPPAVDFPSVAPVHRSDRLVSQSLREAVRPTSWDTERWDRLLGGALGPWAIATIHGRVISMCHTARLAERGAEAGVWTDPDYRGQGHAAAVTAVWASLAALSGRQLFYSTSATNHSSQRVAARLRLRPFARTWTLSVEKDGRSRVLAELPRP